LITSTSAPLRKLGTLTAGARPLLQSHRRYDGRMSAHADLPDYAARNRRHWDALADEYVQAGERHWAQPEPTWGIWAVPESELHLLPGDLGGRDVIELGCGTAYVSAWLARRGARPVGIDNSPRQLETARRLQREHGLDFPLHLGNAERTPFADASFDIAISEYGAAIWCDPYIWIPEAARLLRPGGELIFLANSVIQMLAVPDALAEGPSTDRLRRDQFGMHRFEWPDDDSVEFHISHGDWIRLLRRSGFEVIDLIEIQAPLGATTRYEFTSEEWGRRWPAEEVWKARKVG
jgi:SAM-dependent methyltransferase